MPDVYIDIDKEILIVGKPSFKYDMVHIERSYNNSVRKIWVKKLE